MSQPDNQSASEPIKATRRPVQARTPSWRVEALRTTFWVVPTLLVLAACVLFVATFEIDVAAYHHSISLPGWVETGSAAGPCDTPGLTSAAG